MMPGTWLDYEDSDWAWSTASLLQHMEQQFFEANLCLNLFLANLNSNSRDHSRDDWERDSQRRAAIRKEVEEGTDHSEFSRERWEEIQIETELRFKREAWRNGRLPREFSHNQIFIHARSFLYALDLFEKFLTALKQTPGVPREIKQIRKEFLAAFPDLKGVRDTAQHMEDRARLRSSSKSSKPLELKPIDNHIVKAEGGVLILNSLIGTKYGNTMSDGHYGEVDVSPESMEKLRDIFQRIVDLFAWKGPKRHSPSV